MQQQLSTAVSGDRRSTAEFGSDVVVELLQALEIPYIALNPGASYRGLHDSLVNFGLSPGPQIVLCCHEAIAVAIAGGYARVTGKPLAVGLHDVVGLQNAAMAIYSAWCDRSPMLLMGGTGPMDTTKRRAHIDWVHTALVQGNAVRDIVKWDDQPATVASLPDSILRAYRIAMTEPQGPIYLCFDTELQEEAVDDPPLLPDVNRFAPPSVPGGSSPALEQAAALLTAARWPVIVPDMMGRNRAAIPALQELAETLGCAVVDDGSYYNFPSTHPLDLSLAAKEAIGEADVVLALDVVDLGGALGTRLGRPADTFLSSSARVIHITLGDFWHSGWAGDHERLHPVDVPIAASSADALPRLVELCRVGLSADPGAPERVAQRRQRIGAMHAEARRGVLARAEGTMASRPISASRLYRDLWDLIQGTSWSLAGGGGGVARAIWEFTEPDQRSGVGRGAGIGYSAAAAVGAGLAYRESGRLPICVSGDGSFLMFPQVLWTAANSHIPMLYVIFDNHSYFNDENHQENVARRRGRSVENKGIGIRLDEPETDFAGLARCFGGVGFGPITDPDALKPALAEAIRVVREERRTAVVDVIVQAQSGT